MSEADPAIPRQVPFPIVRSDRIPAKRYYDDAFYQAELEHLWPHVWQMACRIEQIPNVGDWVEYANVGQSVIVVRTEDGIKAYHNACRHRGVPIAGGDGNGRGNCRRTGFICPFHGWRWNLHGDNTFVYARHMFDPAQLDPADIALRACRVELWGGCVFINHDEDAPGFRESIGPAAARLEARGAEHLRADVWFETVLPANWKTAMEAFMEGFHVMRTHPQLHQIVPAFYNARYGQDTGGIGTPVNPNATVRENIVAQVEHLRLINEGMAGQCSKKEIAIAEGLIDVDLPDDPAIAVPQWYMLLKSEITRQLRARGERVPDLNALDAADSSNGVEMLFPHSFLVVLFTSMSAYRIRPLGPESCLFELWSLTTHPEGQEPEPLLEPTRLHYASKDWPAIPQQDYANIPIQQKGLHSTGFEYMRLARDVEGLIGNFHRALDDYLAGRPAERLLKSVHALGGTFDGKIAEAEA